jgi:hypothetical protein
MQKKTHLFPENLHSQLHTMSFPVFLQLYDILDTLIGHFTLVDLVLVISDSPPHLSAG